MVRHVPSATAELRGRRLAQMPRVPRYRRVVVVLLVMLAPVAGTLDFVSLSTAARSATTDVRFQPPSSAMPSSAMPSWPRMTAWFGTSFHLGSIISAPHVVGPLSDR